MSLSSREQYESFIYALPHIYPALLSSSLHLYTISRYTAVVRGRLHFHNGLELQVREVLDFSVGEITEYGYTVYCEGERIRWYDPQPHPENPALAVTFPHHRHEPPDIKHNRQPAPDIGFDAPNLPTLIADCIALGEMLGNRAAD